jgi:hypothetical protein
MSMPAPDAPFLLPGAVRHDPAIAAWFAVADPFRPVLAEWFARMRACGNDVREILHDRCPTACAGAAAFAYVAAYRAHAAIGFFHGAWLPDPEHLLEGSGVHMRHVKLGLGESRDEAALKALIDAAYRAARPANG